LRSGWELEWRQRWCSLAWLFAVSVRDLRTMAAILLILAAIALMSCILPASRAAKIAPIVALRSE
jgi:ABC-type antimicrobial peptide transport system permease subunit